LLILITDNKIGRVSDWVGECCIILWNVMTLWIVLKPWQLSFPPSSYLKKYNNKCLTVSWNTSSEMATRETSNYL
jgi:hypothetical protein